MKNVARPAGFTLVELIITVAIVGILTAVAVPSYRESVSRGHRTEAKAALLDNAQFLERHFTECNRYNQYCDDLRRGDGVLLPITVAPRDGTASYNIDAPTLTATTYVLTATPISGGRMEGDACGEFSLTNFGQKRVDGNQDGTNDPALVDTCWAR